MTEADARAGGLALMESCLTCLLGTNTEEGYPNIKAMLNLRHEGLKTVWFSTNTSSKHVAQLERDNRACLYYVNDAEFKGLMLEGTVELCRDMESRQLLWADGSEVYYPGGVTDPDYMVLKFTARRGNYYHRLANITFDIS